MTAAGTRAAFVRATQFYVFICLGLAVPFQSNAQPAPGYYDTADTSSPAALRSSLHEIIDDHTRFPYTSTSTDTWDILEIADEDQDNAGNVITIYRNASYPKQGGGNSFYNREHTWPKSYGFPNDGSTNYPYTDTHHLFIADSGYNSSRSNKPYNFCDASCLEKPTDANNGRGGVGGAYPGDSNWTSGSFTQGTWETWTGRRGDVARAMFYMDVRYEGGTHGITGVAEPDLILTDDSNLIDQSNTGSNESVAYMGMLSVLLQWHAEDPVDLVEFQHNEAVALHQGNRNPFVDHPEWVDCVFGGTCGGGGDTTPPAPPAGLSATPGSGVIDLDWADNGEPDLAGYRVYRAEVSGGPYTQINAGLVTVSGYQDAGVTGGVTYYYVVTAEDTSGNESASSNEASATASGGTPIESVWINEFHYDNDGGDKNEAVEVAGSAGTDLAGWTLVGYNGSGGAAYQTINLSGTIADQQGCIGTVNFNFSGLQNGAPDGIALVDDTGTVIEFLSYEGTFTATDGPAAGLTSVDVGVEETSGTPKGHSLQLAGTGASAADFIWQSPQGHTRGAVNAGQTFDGCGADITPPAAPTGLVATPLDAQVLLDWNANGEPDLAGYHVYRATVSGGPYTRLNGSLLATNSYTDTSAVNGTTYYYVVTAEDGAGNESANSAEASATPQAPQGGSAWINEFHYDNDGADAGEFVEVAGPAGTDLAGWQLIGYNGNGGGSYKTVSLSGVIPNQSNGFGTLAFDFSALQNGSPDGIALVDGGGAVVEFLSYEGAFTATDGPAAGLSSEDVGVTEPSTTPIGYSLQRTGNGSSGADFTWAAPGPDTYGAPNTGQSF